MFNLEKAITEWKKIMRKKRAIQDGDLVELESYLRDKVDDLVSHGMSKEDAFHKAEAEFIRASSLDSDYYRARSLKSGSRPPWQAPRFMPALFWNYLKIAGRKIRRQKSYAAIAIGSLALAMAVGFLILAWVQYEFSYDRFHRNASSIYRVLFHTKSWGEPVPYVPYPLYSAVKDNFPEVRAVSRAVKYRTDETRLESSNIIDYKSWILLVDPVFLTMFDFPLVQGDPRTVLSGPKSVVLTESAAKKFFGAGDPLGKTLLAGEAKIPLEVRGVLKDIPETSHIDFDLMMPMDDLSLWEQIRKPDEWNSFGPSLYVRLTPGADVGSLEGRLTGLMSEHVSEQEPKISLQRLTDIHIRPGGILGDSRLGRPRTPVSLGQIRIFLFVALIVIVMGMVNTINLATARSLKRFREIGIRKVAGAKRSDIVRQFLGESILYSFAALGAAAVLGAGFGLPLLRRLSGLAIDPGLLPIGTLCLEFAGLALAIGLVAGLYPALFVSAFPPQKVLKESFVSGRPGLGRLRGSLVAVQIICSAALITVISVLALQIRYIDRKDLGFKRDSILAISTPIDRDRLGAFKSELMAHPSIRGAATGFLPLMGARGHYIQGKDLWWEGKSPETLVFMDWHFVDEDYLKTYGLELVAGRFFSKDFPSDKNSFVLNESAVKAMGLADPIGKHFRARGQEGPIIGVIRDFHANTLKAKIMPMYFVHASGFFGVSVQFDPRNAAAAIGHIAEVVKKFEPERPLEYTFLDESLRRMYRSERLTAQILSVFGAVSILISCMGLFGLISLLAEQRTKEIGVRKVLGASVSRIVGMMSADFAGLVVLAIVLAAPVGYIISAGWLGDFAYRISLSWWIFAGAGFLVLVLSLAAMSFRTVRAARANPVDSLRYE